MKSIQLSLSIAILAASLLAAGCSSDSLGGAALGAGVVGGAYEYQNKQAIDDLERDYRDGRISRSEYSRRRNEIEDRSIIY